MMEHDPFAFRRLFNISMSYGGVVFLLLCISPLRQLTSEAITAESLQAAGAAIGGLLPVGMAISAVVAGMVRKVLFHCGGINRQSLRAVFLLGAFWHLPLTLCLAHAASRHEPGTAWQLLLYFTATSLVAAAALCTTLWKTRPGRHFTTK